jgi:2-oxoglutarate ferredoxin oxidoreductase subunit alpha
MAGYPMTPATSILDYFSKAASGLPIHFEQAEDEIAAINMVLGASYAGVRSMAATSGGGFALMQEAVSLAAMTETPVVIAVSQRPGPGLPQDRQADLHFVLTPVWNSRGHLRPGSIRNDCPDGKEFRLADHSFQFSF